MGDHANIQMVRRATVRGGVLVVTPEIELPPNEVHGGDCLAEAALRAAHALLWGLSPEERAATGIVVGTASGCIETDREFDRSRIEAGGRYASPAAFSRTLPSTVMAEVALRCGLRGPSLLVSAGEASGELAVERARRWMEHFGLRHCLAGRMEWVGERCEVEMVLLERLEFRL